MKRFSFRLDALLRLRRHRRDLCRQLLSQALAAEQEFVQRRLAQEAARRGVLDEIRARSGVGRVDIDGTSSRRFHAARLSGEIAASVRGEELAQRQVVLCREALVRADRDVKVLEKLEERQRRRFLNEEERRTQQQLEDAWRGGALGRSG